MSSLENTIQFTEGNNSAPSSREDLESFYLRAIGIPDLDDQASALSQAGRAYYTLYQEKCEIKDLEKAISIHEEAIQLTSVFHPKLAYRLKHAAHALKAQFEQNGDPPTIEKAISHYEIALGVTSDSDPGKVSHLYYLATAHHLRFERFGSLEDIDKAIINGQKAADTLPDHHTGKPSLLSDLGNFLLCRYNASGNLADLDSAIAVVKKAVEVIQDSHPGKPPRLDILGNLLSRRFERLGSLADIDNAIAVARKAVYLTPDGHPDKPFRLNNLGVSLTNRYERLGNLIDLDSAIEFHKKAVEIAPDGHIKKPDLLSNHGNSLIRRFERFGSLTDLDSAIVSHQKAVEVTPDDYPDKSNLLGNLGNSLFRRFERFGSLIDLDNAILFYQKAIEMTPDDNANKPNLLKHLGISLTRRFEQLGSLPDLDSAIAVHKNAVEVTPDGHPDKASRLNNLGGSLIRRFERLDSLTDLETANVVHQTAVALVPDGHIDKPNLLSNLGNSLFRRFERLGSLNDLNSAIAVHKEAAETTPDGHPDKPFRLNSLGISLTSRFERLESFVDLDSGIAVLQKAVELTQDGHPDKPSRLKQFGNSLYIRFNLLSNPKDLDNTLQSYSRAAHSLTGPPMVRFEAARRWSTILDQQHRSPLLAFQCAIDLLPRIAWLGLVATDQHALLANVGDVVRDAVAAAVNLEEYETAVEWMEQGRSIVWQNLLSLRSPMDNLSAVNPALANRLRGISRELESTVPGGTESDKTPAVSMENIAQKYSKLGTEWDSLVEEIRKIPNFEGFMKTSNFAKLAPAASEGPVIILNVSKYRSDALVLIQDGSTKSGVSVTHIPLQSFVYMLSGILVSSTNRLLASARGVHSRNFRSIPQHEPARHDNFSYEASLENHLDDLMGGLFPPGLRPWSHKDKGDHGELNFPEILGLLWLGVVKPVLDGLAISAESGDPLRVWWCATGPLSFLPIHAAGIYGTGIKGHIASDYVISSYIPTLTSILDQSKPTVHANFRMLTVAASQIPYAVAIPGAEEEVALIQTLAETEGVHCVNLTKETATVKHVLKEITESDWIHLACHGQQNIEDPMKSGFFLHDRILQLSEIVKLSLPKADFAFLSAGDTARGDEKVAEESVHLAAGMLLLGCRGVIATMWSIDDNDAPKVAKDVYRKILEDGKPNRKEAAYALHGAVKRLRESGADFISWVPFIHVGR